MNINFIIVHTSSQVSDPGNQEIVQVTAGESHEPSIDITPNAVYGIM